LEGWRREYLFSSLPTRNDLVDKFTTAMREHARVAK
jgi:hypothetical protein